MKNFFTISFVCGNLIWALVACNKSGSNAPQTQVGVLPSPQPQIGLPHPQFQQQWPQQQIQRKQAAFETLVCVGVASDISGRSGNLLDMAPFEVRFPWDTTEVKTIPLVHPFANQLGNINLKLQPHSFDQNGGFAGQGYIELSISAAAAGSASVAGGAPPGNTTPPGTNAPPTNAAPVSASMIRAPLNSHVKIDVEDHHREITVTFDCNIVEEVDLGNSKSMYSCQSALPPVQAEQAVPLEIIDFKANSKAQFLNSKQENLKLEIDKNGPVDRIVLSTKSRNGQRTTQFSVPFGHSFGVRSENHSSEGNFQVDCRATELLNTKEQKNSTDQKTPSNATQQK